MNRHRKGNGSDAVFNAVFWLLGAMVVAMFGWTLWRAWDNATSPSYTLRKDQWVCTASNSYQITEIGKYRNHTASRTVCSQYTHLSEPAKQ